MVRERLDPSAVRPILRRLSELEEEVPALAAQLAAATVGDDDTRAEAWWTLWTRAPRDQAIDEAALPAVPVLTALAGWPHYPDRVPALMLLREVACADRITPRHDHDEFAELREALASGIRHIASRWRTEPPEIRRALVWVLGAVPEVRVQFHALIDETLPADRRPEWEEQLLGASASPALESWVVDG